jgi:hypothetical protein
MNRYKYKFRLISVFKRLLATALSDGLAHFCINIYCPKVYEQIKRHRPMSSVDIGRGLNTIEMACVNKEKSIN